MYGISYSVGRILAEFFRQPDSQLGFIYSNWVTMGMLQSVFTLGICVILYMKVRKINS